MSEKQQRFYWKGKLVSAKVYKRRCEQSNIAKKIQKIVKNKCGADNLKNDSNCKVVNPIEGRRIIHVQTLAEQLICKKCNSILSLTDTFEEKRVGLASIFYVKCRVCRVTSSACTDKQHDTAGQNLHFDTNTKAVIGTCVLFSDLCTNLLKNK